MTKRKIKLLTTVALNKDLPGRKLRRGEVGTVVEVLGPDVEKIVLLRCVGEQHQLPVAERVGLGHERGP